VRTVRWRQGVAAADGGKRLRSTVRGIGARGAVIIVSPIFEGSCVKAKAVAQPTWF
jgi:hypothetical protein